MERPKTSPLIKVAMADITLIFGAMACKGFTPPQTTEPEKIADIDSEAAVGMAQACFSYVDQSSYIKPEKKTYNKEKCFKKLSAYYKTNRFQLCSNPSRTAIAQHVVEDTAGQGYFGLKETSAFITALNATNLCVK
jgi:hypothetical protein